ncbi:hypothetical protein [Sphingomonas paucimobilis]|uniref:hypothetical protein n=1 Tax=Sphingomonas paucimobilis TaxID=13689 RepID=UPI0030F8C4AF
MNIAPTPLRTRACLRLADLVLGCTRVAVRHGLVRPALLIPAFRLSKALTRIAMRVWRRAQRSHLRSVTRRSKTSASV